MLRRMKLPSSQSWSRFSDFVRTPSLARSVTGLLVLAFVLLLTVNISTFVMIQRTATVNDAIEHAQQMRRQSRTVLISMLNAETAQRGFLLTGRSDFLTPFEEARAEREPALAFLEEGAAADPTILDQNYRPQRTDTGQRQNCQPGSPSAMEKKTTCARPRIFSNGMVPKPSGSGTRLSVELSRLSPIMK